MIRIILATAKEVTKIINRFDPRPFSRPSFISDLSPSLLTQQIESELSITVFRGIIGADWLDESNTEALRLVSLLVLPC